MEEQSVFTVTKTVHSRKKFDLYVVQLANRVPRESFMELLDSAKVLGGWYSSFKGNGAIPGFQFKQKTASDLFITDEENIGLATNSPGNSSPSQGEVPKGGRGTNGEPKSKGNCPPHRGTSEAEGVKGNLKLAKAWQKLADSYNAEAQKKFAELKHTQSNTPKRMRQYNSKQIDADMLTDRAKLAEGLANRFRYGNLPALLLLLEPVKARDHLRWFINSYGSNGYYDVHRLDYPYYNGEAIKELKMSAAEADKVYKLLWETNTESNAERKERERQAHIKQLEDKVRFANIDGFFPTPDELANRMVTTLNLKSTDIVLEPSAGMGSLAEAVRKRFPACQIDLYEINYSLCDLLKAKGFENVVPGDFLTYKPYPKYHKIIMNPPFERWMDIDHVQRAYEWLLPGGKMVAIMGAGAFQGSTKKHIQFHQWIGEVGASYHQLPEGSFKSAFRQTGVHTYYVIIDKPE